MMHTALAPGITRNQAIITSNCAVSPWGGVLKGRNAYPSASDGSASARTIMTEHIGEDIEYVDMDLLPPLTGYKYGSHQTDIYRRQTGIGRTGLIVDFNEYTDSPMRTFQSQVEINIFKRMAWAKEYYVAPYHKMEAL